MDATSLRILVTGSQGFIGSVTTPQLLDAGHEVVGLDTEYYAGCDLVPDVVSFPVHHLDIRDVTEEHLAGVDAVVHLAALSNDPLGDLDPALTYAINWHATTRLARLARDVGVSRFVFASSCSMYGAAAGDNAVDEEAPLAPLTPYATSKVEAERELLALATDEFTPVSLRNATAFGPSPRLRADVVVNNLVCYALTTGIVRLLSDGSAWRPLVSAEDIGQAIRLVVEAPAELVRGRAFNVGFDEQNYRVREIAEIVRSAIPGTEVEVGATDADNRSYRVAFGRFAETFPSFAPRHTVAEGARQVAEALRASGFNEEIFAGDRFIRLRRLHSLREAGALDDALRWVHAPVV